MTPHPSPPGPPNPPRAVVPSSASASQTAPQESSTHASPSLTPCPPSPRLSLLPPPLPPPQGGGAFILIRLSNGSSVFIDAREPAPAAANATMYEGKDKYASLDGGLAVAVPCELRGLEEAWRRYGKLPWGKLVAPAAEMARSGFGAHVSGPCAYGNASGVACLLVLGIFCSCMWLRGRPFLSVHGGLYVE